MRRRSPDARAAAPNGGEPLAARRVEACLGVIRAKRGAISSRKLSRRLRANFAKLLRNVQLPHFCAAPKCAQALGVFSWPAAFPREYRKTTQVLPVLTRAAAAGCIRMVVQSDTHTMPAGPSQAALPPTAHAASPHDSSLPQVAGARAAGGPVRPATRVRPRGPTSDQA